MAVVAELLSGIFAINPDLVILGILLIILVALVVKLFVSGPPPGPNPFEKDTVLPAKPLVTDQAARDRVLKDGFHVKKIPENLDAICIGSGIGSLATAGILARAGKKVLVLEQHDQAGGCCHSYIEKGFEFDVGIHYIGEMNTGSVAQELVAQLTDGQLTWVDLVDDYDVVALGEAGKERRYAWVKGKKQWRDNMIKYFPDEGATIDKFLDMVQDVCTSAEGMMLLKLYSKTLGRFLVKTGLINFITKYFKYASRTLQEVLDDLTDNEELKAVLSYNFGDYGTLPRDSSFYLHAGLFDHFQGGASYPLGGASEIAFHMIPPIERAGGRVLVRARVTEILFNGQGDAIGVRVPRQFSDIDIHAPIIISDAGVINTFTKLMPKEIASKSDIYKHIGKKLDSGVGALSLFVGLRGTAEELGLKAQNVWAFPSNQLDKISAEFMNKPSLEEAIEDDVPIMFISFPSAKDPTFNDRYPGKSTLAVITLSPWKWFSDWQDKRHKKRGEDYESLKQMIADRMMQQVYKYYPQIMDRVEYMEVGTPLSNNFYIASPKGEIYGLDHTRTRFSNPELVMDLRPESGIPGLYLTGQDVSSCGFMGGLMGGLITSIVLLNRNVYSDLENLQKTKTNKKNL